MGKRTKAHQKYIHRETGKPVPGATTIIGVLGYNKNVLMRWAAKEAAAGRDPFAVRDVAASIGTLAHAMIEEHYGEMGWIEPRPLDRSEYAPADIDKAETAFLAYLEWEGRQDIEVLEAELQLVHPHYYYGGTIDMLCKLNGRRTMVDFKTSKGVYPDHVIQLAAYRTLIVDTVLEDTSASDDLLGEWVEAPSLILHLSKDDGRFTAHEYKPKQLEVFTEAFFHAYELYYLKKRLKV